VHNPDLGERVEPRSVSVFNTAITYDRPTVAKIMVTYVLRKKAHKPFSGWDEVWQKALAARMTRVIRLLVAVLQAALRDYEVMGPKGGYPT
jgi:hypothetical protein